MMKRWIAFLTAALLAAGLALGMAESGEDMSLPAYRCSGEDEIVAAVADYIADITPQSPQEPSAVAIPAPVILKMEQPDDAHAIVYGNFWHFRYVLDQGVLRCVSGGESAGVMQLEKTEDGWAVTALETAGDGEDYARDIQRFCNGDKELEQAYFSAEDVSHEPLKSIRTQFIRDYVEANDLPVTAYQDYGWPPVALYDE